MSEWWEVDEPRPEREPGTYEIRACFEVGDPSLDVTLVTSYSLDAQDMPEATPNYYGIYYNLPNGTQRHIEDHQTLNMAIKAGMNLAQRGGEKIGTG